MSAGAKLAFTLTSLPLLSQMPGSCCHLHHCHRDYHGIYCDDMHTALYVVATSSACSASSLRCCANRVEAHQEPRNVYSHGQLMQASSETMEGVHRVHMHAANFKARSQATAFCLDSVMSRSMIEKCADGNAASTCRARALISSMLSNTLRRTLRVLLSM